jgi:uncharacterized protein involved in exopolysaccharide biosynthesis
VTTAAESPDGGDAEGRVDLLELLITALSHWKTLVLVPLLVGALAAAGSYLLTPIYTARTSILPPASTGGAAAALANLNPALGNLAGAAGVPGLRSPADQYVALLQSVTVADRIIDEFKLIELYGVDMRMKARKLLASRVSIAAGRRDGIITIEVDDASPQRAADMANRYVDELRRLTARLALTEAQQRRQFFEQQMAQTRDKLTAAQQALLASGYSENTLKAEPRAAAEGFAKLRAELTAAEVRLQALRSQFRDQTPEVEQQAAAVGSLRAALAAQQRSDAPASGPDYVSRFREFKYQEALFDQIARQYEIAKIDESRDGGQLQVVDAAQVPERKTKPKRSLFMLVAFGLGFLLSGAFVLRQHLRRPG